MMSEFEKYRKEYEKGHLLNYSERITANHFWRAALEWALNEDITGGNCDPDKIEAELK